MHGNEHFVSSCNFLIRLVVIVVAAVVDVDVVIVNNDALAVVVDVTN